MRASVIIQEWDLSTRVPSFPGVYCGVVGAFEKGPVGVAQLQTSESQLLQTMTNDETVKVGSTTAYYSALAALIKSNKVWCVRAANSPKYGAATLKVDKPVQSIGISANLGLSSLMLNHTTETDLVNAEMLYNVLSTGDKVVLSASSGGSIPAPLVAGNTYYIIKIDDVNFKLRVAESVEKARNGEFIVFTDAGSGTLTLTIPNNGFNTESEYAISRPESYQMNSSDGKLAGNQSLFTVDVNNDAFEVTSSFHAMVSTGDTIKLTATTFPAVDTGADLDDLTTYYIIKQDSDGVSYKIQLARSISDANSGIYIGILSQGSSVDGTLQNKIQLDGSIVADETTEQFTVDPKFFAACQTNDRIRFTATGVYPTVSSGTPFDSNTDYFIIKGINNKVQLAREIDGSAVAFSDNGTGPMIFSLQDKASYSSLTGDLSNDLLTVSETFFEWVSTGFAVTVSSDGVLPEGLSANTTYYLIKTDVNNKVKLASTAANAQLGVAVDILNAGTGNHTIFDTHNLELVGLDQKLLLIYTSTPCAEELYIKTIHYPYGDPSTWTDDQKTAASTVKEPNAFILYLYKKDKDNNLYLVESYLLSRIKGHKDGNGKNIYCEEAITASNYIRILDNVTLDEKLLPIDQSDFLKLTNGSIGNSVTDSDMLQALDAFKSRRNIFVTVLMDGGWTTPAYQKQGLIQLCENRKDCIALLNVPISYEQSSDYINQILKYRKEELNANTSYAGLYSSHLLIQDKYNNRQIYVPADGYVAAAISETALNYEIWYPPAGNRRGQLNVLDVTRRFSEGEQDILYDNGINPIDFYPGKGIRIWGQKTLLSRPSATDRMNVRLLLIVIEPAIAEFLEDFNFEFNDEITRIQVKSGINSYMENIKTRRGVYAYNVICDASNNTPAIIDANKMNVDLYVQPVKAAEFIQFRTIITPTGSTFTVVG